MKKTRLTITLSRDLLTQIDQTIDRHTIRNRSHAIEHLLTKTLQPSVSQAIILAGGKKDHHNQTIRALTKINNKPLILHTIDHLKQFGISLFVIATSSQAIAIEEFLGNGSSLGVKIKYIYEKSPLGTGGAIKHSLPHLDPKPFLVIAGDVLTTINIHDFINFHLQNKGLVTVAVKPRSPKKSYDHVLIQGSSVVDFQAGNDQQQVGIVNTGLYIFQPQIAEYFPQTQTFMLETDLFPKLATQNQMKAFSFQGLWFDISSDENYKKAVR